MSAPVLKIRPLTVDEYHAMAEAGIFAEDERIELLDGQLIEMPPIGSRHFHCVNRLNRLLADRAPFEVGISVQNPVRLNDRSEPEPDLVLLRPGVDESRLPGPDDVLLLIEVADTTLEKDRTEKLPRYAAAGIPELWIVALPEDRIEVYRRPAGNDYKVRLLFQRGDELDVEALPDAGPIPVDDVLG